MRASSHFASALGKVACVRSAGSRCILQLYLEGLWWEGRKRTNGARKLVRKHGTLGLLVVDE
ncbi:hypothetical protein [Collinsella aerofaciens]|uniref:hypothetical protein n=1 Tax=Collinsella aerofaciens TaxID=74426 RepID=UPI00359C3ED7